jgi:invasion protein IalB
MPGIVMRDTRSKAERPAIDQGEAAMKRTTAAAMAMLGAWSGNGPAPAAMAQAASGQAAGQAAGDAATDAAPTPRPGPTRTFGDWYVGCDNIATCTMASLGGEGQAPSPTVTLAVTRGAGPGGGFALVFGAPGGGVPVAPVAVTIDGRRLALPTLTGAAAAALVAQMANGHTLAVLEAGDRTRATLSLKGAAAALRWIDERQGRVDTVTAAVAKGDRPADAVPPPPRAPVIAALAALGTPPQPPPLPTRVQFAAMRRRAQCEEPPAGAAGYPESHALGGGATLVMVPCSVGAYNLSSALFVLENGAWRPAQADVPTGLAPPGEGSSVPSVVNGQWRGGELTSYTKGRGLGDCGVAQTFVWDGTRLRLSAQSEMGECRGNPNYVTTWRTRVVRR